MLYRVFPKDLTLIANLISLLPIARQELYPWFGLMALFVPIAGISGYLWLSDFPTIVAAIMLFASGAILYSIFQDIAPQVKLKRHYAPPMGAILGFVLGIIGLMVTA